MESTTVTLEQALPVYQLEFLTARNFTPLTRRHYLIDLRELVDYLTASHLTLVGTLNKFHLDRYLAHLDGRGLSGNSRRRKVASIRSFAAFCTDRGYLSHNIALRLIPPERELTEPRFLSETEYKRLMDVVRFKPRDGAIIELLLQTGLRLSELCRLRWIDVQLPSKPSPDAGNAGQVTIYGKGRKQRTVTLNWKACLALSAYQEVRPDSPFPEIFLTKFLRPIGPRGVEDVVAKYLARAGIEGATVHTMRHTFATAHVRKKTDLKVVQTALGHANIATTSRYVGLVREEMNKQLQENAL